MLNLLTPTGARPEAFEKCVEYMKAQTYTGPVRWIIVDDGPEAMDIPRIKDWQIVHVRPEPLWQPGQNTQARNLKEGLKYVDGPLIIIEDDDEYAPWWLETCDKWLQFNDLVGEAPSLYRHLNGTEKCMNNHNHASLCATAMKGEVVQKFERILNYKKGIDVQLWRECGQKYGRIYPYQGGVVGIKGYPGRPGIGMGHKLKSS
jgi:hypothetical protein